MKVWILALACLALMVSSQPAEDLVNYLVGAPDFNFEIYSGYLNVSNSTDSKTINKKLHYVLVETKTDDPDEAPLVIWLNGGPGCSSLLGMFMENGPWVVDDCNNTFYENQYSWNQRVSVLYIEGPAGVGYSYAS